MRRLSLILMAALLISALSFSSVFAQSPENTSTSGTAVTTSTSALGACGWGNLEGQTIHGKLYAGPGFNLKEFMRTHPEFSWANLNAMNKTVVVGAIPGKGLANGSLVGCNIIVLPSA